MRTCVCVPARRERERLPRLLDALLAQRGVAPETWCACFWLDGDDDGSADLLQAFARRAPFAVGIETRAQADAPNAGRARRAALALGLQRLEDFDDGVLLTTDADSAPAPDWILSARRALLGCDIVAGRVARFGEEDEGWGDDGVQDRLERYYDRLYALRRRLDPLPWEPEPRHHFTAGANLALRAAAYVALGGFDERPSGEDAHLIDEAGRAGLRVRRAADVVVETSGRREGRAPGGLAAALRTIDRDGEGAVAVAHPADAAWQYHRHAVARAVFAEVERPLSAARLSALIDRSPQHLAGVAAQCANGEAFANRIVPVRPGGPRTASLAEAETALARLEGDLDSLIVAVGDAA